MRLPRGAAGVPTTSWSSGGSRWRARPPTLVVLVAGLWIFGSGESALIEAQLGNSPWTVFAQGLGAHAGLSIGESTFLISAAILALWPLLGERLGLGTVANAVIIAAAIEVMTQVMPQPHQAVARVAQVFVGIAGIGLGSGLYLTANLGPGPRDGLMTGLHHRLGRPVARVRLGIELSVVLVGWLLGGTVGVGTVLFAALVGYAVSLGLALVTPRRHNPLLASRP